MGRGQHSRANHIPSTQPLCPHGLPLLIIITIPARNKKKPCLYSVTCMMAGSQPTAVHPGHSLAGVRALQPLLRDNLADLTLLTGDAEGHTPDPFMLGFASATCIFLTALDTGVSVSKMETGCQDDGKTRLLDVGEYRPFPS